MDLVAEKYKHTEIGVIPSDWNVKSFDDIIHFTQLGGNYPNNNNQSQNVLIKMANLGRGNIELNKMYFIQSEINPSENDRVKYGDILFNTRNTLDLVGKVAVWRDELPIAYFNSNIMRIVFKEEEISSNFFMNLILNSRSCIYQLRGIATGTTSVAAIYSRDFNKVLIPIPLKAEQTAIATALSDADDLICSLEKLIDKKRNIMQGAMQKLLQPKEGWEVKKLGEIGDCIIGLTYSPSNVKESGTLVLRSSNVQGNSLKYDDNVFVDIQVSEKLICRENDILICVRNGSRNLIGKCALIKGMAVGETFGAFMSVFRSPFNEFVFILFQSNIIKRQIDEHLGATINQITNKSLNSFEIPFPPPEEQTEIANILADMDSEINTLESKLEKYRNVKLGMMQNLLTGKIRLVNHNG